MGARARLTEGHALTRGRYVGADVNFVVPPRSQDNPSNFTFDCRLRDFISDTKLVIGVYCYDALHPDPALARAADSLQALD